MDVGMSSEKHRAEAFLERLEGMLRGIPPTVYAPKVSAIMDIVLNDREKLIAKYPPHYLIHSIEANCAYYRSYLNDELDDQKFRKIINHYIKYYDPVAKYFLSEIDDGFYPFLINMARQQFHLQYIHGVNDLGRSIILFCESKYPRAEKLIKNKYGLSFKEWLTIGFGIYASTHDKRPAYISPEYFTNLEPKLADEKSVYALFDILSITVDGVKDNYMRVRQSIGAKIASQYDTYIQGVFTEKPMLRMNENQYIVIYKPLLLKRIAEGIFDLCKSEWPGEFGNEFGHNFERYVENLLLEFIPKNQLITESILRRYSDDKVCDFIIINEDSLYLLECKGTEYSSYIATTNAMKQDNSTRKISTGIEQLYSTAKQIRKGVFFNILGDVSNKRIISSVITFKQLYFANIKWYWDKVISSSMDQSRKNSIEKYFDYRPQVLSIGELEQFLLYSINQGKTHFEIFKEKLGQSESTSGDWAIYLKVDKERVKLLGASFDRFFEEVYNGLIGRDAEKN